jgi:four helix bundle protein
MSQPHENLIAWQRADDLCVGVYELTKRLPASEQFGLTNQLRRAAFSVPANIVEGYAFPKSPTRMRHLRIAVASLAEVGYALRLAKRIGYLSDSEWGSIDVAVRQTAAPLHGLLKQQSGR